MQHANGVLLDPAPGGDDKHDAKCHNDWDPNSVHRFVVVAVTQVDAQGREDLSKKPFTYVLYDDMADWPLMSLHDNYLSLTHYDRKEPGPDPVAIFDAERLANPHPGDDGSALKIKELAKFDANDLVFNESGDTFKPSSVIYPVNMHGDMGKNNLLVSFSGDFLLILGFRSPSGDPSGKPEKLIGRAIPLGRLQHTPEHNPEYRDGMLYVSWHECENASDSCTKFLIRVLRIPVGVDSGDRISVSTDATLGFLDCRFADEDPAVSLFLPMLTVNKDGDMVVAFDRVAPKERISTGVRYRVWYHDHANISDGAWIKEGETIPSPHDVPSPADGGVDLGGIAVDPEDQVTVWMSHAFARLGKLLSNRRRRQTLR